MGGEEQDWGHLRERHQRSEWPRSESFPRWDQRSPGRITAWSVNELYKIWIGVISPHHWYVSVWIWRPDDPGVRSKDIRGWFSNFDMVEAEVWKVLWLYDSDPLV